MIYVENPEAVAGPWELVPTDTGINVLLIKPSYSVAFARTLTRPDGQRIAAPAQVAADLMTGPGRNPSEGEKLITWMERNEPAWRIQQ
jgi:hypothetical protein